MEFRWLVYSNPVTAVEVDDYQRAHDVTQTVAKARLQMRTAPVLQWRDDTMQDWEDVPTIVLPHPTSI